MPALRAASHEDRFTIDRVTKRTNLLPIAEIRWPLSRRALTFLLVLAVAITSLPIFHEVLASEISSGVRRFLPRKKQRNDDVFRRESLACDPKAIRYGAVANPKLPRSVKLCFAAPRSVRLYGRKRLLDVPDQIVRRLDPEREPNELVSNARSLSLLRRKHRMRRQAWYRTL